jgi:large subunit ribosomal protein L10e
MYRKIEGQVYTRKEYMGGIPHCRVTQFDTGNVHMEYRFHYDLVAKEAAQIRDNSLEAARVAMVRVMERVASNNFHLKVRKYPHQILREHKMATGAGADRISDGMRLAFGKPVAHAVRANIGDVIFTLSFRSENLGDAKEAVRKASCKLPVPVKALFAEKANVIEGARAAPIAPVVTETKPAEAATPAGEAAPEEPAAGAAKKEPEAKGGAKKEAEAKAPAKKEDKKKK